MQNSDLQYNRVLPSPEANYLIFEIPESYSQCDNNCCKSKVAFAMPIRICIDKVAIATQTSGLQ
jgi:hypothetical protein